MPSKERVLRDAYELRKHWHYIGDTSATYEISRRLAQRARQEDVITYSDLVRGVVFHLPNVYTGRPFELGIPEWEDLHRAIIGECLAEVSLLTFEAGDCEGGHRLMIPLFSMPHVDSGNSSVTMCRCRSLRRDCDIAIALSAMGRLQEAENAGEVKCL